MSRAPFKLLINSIPLLGEKSGIGKYTQEIVVHLAQSASDFQATYYQGYYTRRLPADALPAGKKSPAGHLKEILRANPLTRKICKKALVWSGSLFSGRHDLYFEPNFIFQPSLRATHKVTTLHDFSCMLYPQWHPEERVRYFEKHLWNSLEEAERIITVSECMRTEAVETFGLDPAKLVVIKNGVDHALYHPVPSEVIAAYRKKKRLDPEYILYVGTIEPRKNIRNLLLAYDGLQQELKERYPLYIAGGKGWNNGDIQALFHKMRHHVRILGFVPEQELPLLYGAASLFVYPSWYEGFGLPVLEAMACACPVLVSDHASLQELCGDSALFAPPGDVDSLRYALHALLQEPSRRRELGNAGVNRAEQYSWEISARQHGELFRLLCNH